jgi:uncharacterized protein
VNAPDARVADSLGEARDQRASVPNQRADTALPAYSPGPGAIRPATWPDPLYGLVHIASWAAALLATPPFARLAGISLSDVPGEILFGRAFPSRLDHVRGVYHLARLARPRDRALQAAALAHDVGHGPFSHLTEPLMREWLGCDHEERAARQLAAVRAALSATALRRLSWLDWDEVAALVVGRGADRRGGLLNGRLDYDNADNVARFVLAAGLGEPGYAPEALARALRLLPRDANTPDPERAREGMDPLRHSPTYLLEPAEADGMAWQVARRHLYGFLHSDHQNLSPHAMLRKAIELALTSGTLPADFLDLTDAQALACLEGNVERGTGALAQRVQAGPEHRHTCLWEAEVPIVATRARAILGEWRARLEVESELASQAGLAPHDVILEVLTSRAGRALPPFGSASRPDSLVWLPAPLPAPRLLHVFISPSAPRDYRRRLRAAAERLLGALGLAPHTGADSPE